VLPKRFLVEDMHLELAHTLQQLQALRARLEATERAVAAQRKRIDALRKRVERAQEKRRKQECHSEQGARQPFKH